MSKELTEAKELTRQAMEKISQHELLEEARERGFVKGKLNIKPIRNPHVGYVEIDHLYISQGGNVVANLDPQLMIIYDKQLNKWAEIIPEQKEERPDRRFKVGDTVRINAEANSGHRIGTIGKIEDLSPWCGSNYPEGEGWSYWIESNGETWCHMEFHLEHHKDKSLHDQIREGGWEKVLELAGKDFDWNIVHNEKYDVYKPYFDKIVAYNRLLGLSKVLNEGKERGEEIFCIDYINEKLNVEGYKLYTFPVFFHDIDDAVFAIEFAEKEWKIFYNAK